MSRTSIRSHLLAVVLAAGALVGAGPVAGGPATGAAPPLVETPAPAAGDDAAWRLPVLPPRCTVAQAESGDVAGCVVAFSYDPAATGWGVPPAPGVGDGWEWQGYTYNGSPALAEWEATTIAANAGEVAGLSPGLLETHVAAQALFEGFLAEIDARGYRVRDASGYSFRCTAGNGGWSCPSGDPADLSNHAWGLAIDMNSSTNPIRTYTGIGDATACATPVETDMPRWVIQAAEKWGLYWGGYGWNGGCPDTITERTSVYRDPPHFEFRGTPRQARAIAAFNRSGNPYVSCTTYVADDGTETEHCGRPTRPAAATRIAVDVDAPDGAEAALINLTATEGDWWGFLTLEDCGPQPRIRATSALTFAPGQAVATMAVVPLGDDDRFCVYRSTSAHSLVDVVAYLGAGDTTGDETTGGAGAGPLWFAPSSPTRLADTRTDTPVPDRGVRPVPTDDPAARIANLAVIEGAGPGYLQAGRCGDLGPDSAFSNLNYMDATVRSNLALVDGGDDGTCVFALREAHVIVDELGRLDAETGYGWDLRPPERVLDTRECSPTWCDDRPGAGQVIELDLGVDSPGAAVAVTVTDTQAPGYVWVGRCAEIEGSDHPATSNVNHMAGQTVTNLALVELDEGAMCLYTLASAHLIVDVQAELVEDRTVGVLPVPPTRVHDSRG